MNAWIYLIIAGIFEMLWVLSLKLSNGFTKIIPSILTLIFMFISVFLLSISFKSIPMGTAYAVWTALGAISIIIIGIMFFGESASFLRIIFLSMVIIGIIGLKLTSS